MQTLSMHASVYIYYHGSAEYYHNSRVQGTLFWNEYIESMNKYMLFSVDLSTRSWRDICRDRTITLNPLTTPHPLTTLHPLTTPHSQTTTMCYTFSQYNIMEKDPVLCFHPSLVSFPLFPFWLSLHLVTFLTLFFYAGQFQKIKWAGAQRHKHKAK